MKNARLGALALLFCSAASAAEVSFTTQVTTPLAIEGLTADADGRLYTTGRAPSPAPCPVWRVEGATLTVVGLLPNPASCNPSGIAFDAHGRLYVADAASGGRVWTLTPDAAVPPTASAFATGVPGTNGLAFDRDGNLWTGDGTTGAGRVWKIHPAGGQCEGAFAGCVEAFRIQPMRNAAGVGRENVTFPGTAQNLVANGLAFAPNGDLLVADTARGAIWKVVFAGDGSVRSPMNCDTTFTANTLCLDAVLVAHPYLEGTDGIALDRAGNIWNSVNERNAIVVVRKDGAVQELFRNPPDAAGLRNGGPLEFPTSPVLVGHRFCTANSDGNRRDNSPNTAGEASPAGPRGKISCMEQRVATPG